MPRVAARTAALLYLTSPISLQYVTVDGRDNVIIAVLITLSMLLLIARRPVGSGAALRLSVCVVKPLWHSCNDARTDDLFEEVMAGVTDAGAVSAVRDVL